MNTGVTCWLLLGDFERAWQETDKIESQRRQGRHVSGQLVWDGTPFDGRAVLIRCSHGPADAIQFIRYAGLVRQKCSNLIVKVQPVLLTLFRTIPRIDRVIALSDPDPVFDVEIECEELPYAFRTTLSSIPNTIPYIHLPASQTSRRNHDSFRVGLSICKNELPSLGNIPNASFHNLQCGTGSDIMETALAISELDLVVTADAVVAHLAGALGVPVWLLLDFDCDWRWLLEREDSPWYPTMKLFRQTRAGDWAAPIRRIKAALVA
jgi:hypothetical protein